MLRLTQQQVACVVLRLTVVCIVARVGSTRTKALDTGVDDRRIVFFHLIVACNSGSSQVRSQAITSRAVVNFLLVKIPGAFSSTKCGREAPKRGVNVNKTKFKRGENHRTNPQLLHAIGAVILDENVVLRQHPKKQRLACSSSPLLN